MLASYKGNPRESKLHTTATRRAQPKSNCHDAATTIARAHSPVKPFMGPREFRWWLQWRSWSRVRRDTQWILRARATDTECERLRARWKLSRRIPPRDRWWCVFAFWWPWDRASNIVGHRQEDSSRVDISRRHQSRTRQACIRADIAPRRIATILFLLTWEISIYRSDLGRCSNLLRIGGIAIMVQFLPLRIYYECIPLLTYVIDCLWYYDINVPRVE